MYHLNTFYLKKTLNAFFFVFLICIDDFEKTTRLIGNCYSAHNSLIFVLFPINRKLLFSISITARNSLIFILFYQLESFFKFFLTYCWIFCTIYIIHIYLLLWRVKYRFKFSKLLVAFQCPRKNISYIII